MPLKSKIKESEIPNEPKELKSILIGPSRVINRPDNLEGGEETEIAVQISVPQEGGWGWVVVTAAFMNIFLLDGIVFTYGSIMADVAKDLAVPDSLAALVNSIAVSMYYTCGPIAGACINRFGFRTCVMTGSVIASFSLFISYFVGTFQNLCLFYGFTAGFGYCLINMSSSLVVGFYFERLRSVALAIAASGSSMGIMVQYPLYTILGQAAGWRDTTLLHAGALALVYFLGMTFRPLLSVTVQATVDEGTRIVTNLPSVASISKQRTPSKTKVTETLQPTPTERLFSAVSNARFPTTAAIIQESVGGSLKISSAEGQDGPSTAAVASKLIISAQEPKGGFSHRQMKQIKSIMSKSNVAENVEFIPPESTLKIKKPGLWKRIFHWEDHHTHDRPLYRDDVFYEGNVEQLPTYQKSTMGIPEENLTGLEYRLAVSRAATKKDLEEKRGICTTALRRILATMLDPVLLQKPSFILISSSGLLFFVGYLVPYVFIASRNLEEGIDTTHCNLFVSAIGLANTIGRMVLGYLTGKINPLKLFQCTCLAAGLATITSSMTYNVYYQYFYCLTYGFCISCTTSLRSTALVSMYGLDKLTNATGILLMFQGLGSLASTPMAGAIKDSFGFTAAFMVAGGFMVISGILLLPIGGMINSENAKDHGVDTSKKNKRKQKKLNVTIDAK